MSRDCVLVTVGVLVQPGTLDCTGLDSLKSLYAVTKALSNSALNYHLRKVKDHVHI